MLVIEGLLMKFCKPKSKFFKQVSPGYIQMNREADFFKYLRRVKRMDAAFEMLLSKKQRLLLDHQDKVRILIDDDSRGTHVKKGI